MAHLSFDFLKPGNSANPWAPRSAFQQDCPLSAPVNEFTVRLLQQLVPSDGPISSLFLSPFSVSTALSMLMLGARGRSLDQISACLGFDALADTNTDVHQSFQQMLLQIAGSSSNMVIGSHVLMHKTDDEGEEEDPVMQKYEEDIKNVYLSKVTGADFTRDGAHIMQIVNGWVNSLTRGCIPMILSAPPPADTRMIIMNAIYFREKWEKQFKVRQTQEMPFFISSSSQKQLDFMVMTDQKFAYTSGTVAGQEVQLLQLNYAYVPHHLICQQRL